MLIGRPKGGSNEVYMIAFSLMLFAQHLFCRVGIMVYGWRQSHLYFNHQRRRLLQAFSLPPHLEAYAQVRSCGASVVIYASSIKLPSSTI